MAASKGLMTQHHHQHDAGSSQLSYEVQSLFEQTSIEDIRKTESNTRKEVEDKRQELRKLIGNKYRDLIESADSIVTMKQNADLLFARIETMRGDLHSAGQPKAIWTPKTSDGNIAAAQAKRSQTLATASKIKVILETPEHIWTALAREKHLEATLLYHQALVLHASTGLAIQTMPVASRQWNVVSQFPSKIDLASKEFLSRPDHLPVQYASALCALAMLEKPAPSQIFAEFLSARTRLLEKISQGVPSNNDDIVSRLRSCIFAVTSTFFLVFYIFTCPSSQPNPKNLKLLSPAGHKDPAAIPRTKHSHHLGTHLHAAISPSPPYFYSILQTVKDDLDSIYKTHNIAHGEDGGNDAFFTLHIPSASVNTQCEQWLAHCARHLHAHASSLLSHISGAQALAHVRDNVRAGLNEVIGTTDISWSNVCQLVLGRDVDLWEVLCTELFSSRAREIVAHSFQTMDFDGAIKVLLRVPSVGVGTGLWATEGGRDDKDIPTTQNKAAGLTPSVHEFVKRFDSMLSACLADLAHLTFHSQPPAPLSPKALRPPPSPRIPQPAVKPVPTVQQHGNTQAANTALEEYVQDRCFAGVTSFLETVKSRLEVLQVTILTSISKLPTTPALTQPTTITSDEEARKFVDEALLIAQAARALSSTSKQLAAALVPSSTLAPHTTPSTPSAPQRKSKQPEKDAGPANTRLTLIKTTLRQCYLRGYVLWARWVTVTHAQWLASFVHRDSWSDTTRKHGWEEHKAIIEGEDGTPVEEKLYLPFQPSPYVLEFLFSVCREIHRAGGHTVQRTALEYLARELACAVLDLYVEVAQTHQGGGASKEGGVQLLCDACFLIHVLNVPDTATQGDEDLKGILSTLPKGDSTVSVAQDGTAGGTEKRMMQAMAWDRRVTNTVDSLENLLDPIDLAFYGPHVKSFVSRCYQRSSVLFGALVQLHRPNESQAKAPPIVDHNIIPLAKPIARFGYLPTSVPTTSHSVVAHKHSTVNTPVADNKEAKKLSFMEQGVGSLKKFTSLNMLSSTFTTSPTSPQPQHTTTGLSTTPPKTQGNKLGSWFL